MPDRPIRRGEVFLVHLSSFGSRLRKTRPALIVQNDLGNRFSPETIVAAIRDIHGGPMLPVFVPIPSGVGCLLKDSVADLGHLYTIPKEALGRRIGALPPEFMRRVDKALAASLGIGE